MSILVFEEGDRFIVRVFKAHHDNPSDEWVNSYEFTASESSSEGALLTLGDAVVAFEKELHLVEISFVRMVISTWEADSVPYDPAAFLSTTLTGVGGRGVTTGIEPLNECLSVARVGTSGRQGHIFYRGVLDASDVFAPGGRASLIDDTDIQDLITAALTASGLDDYIGATPAGPFALSLINKTGTQNRRVVGLVAAGISFLPLDHAWFNRTTGP